MSPQIHARSWRTEKFGLCHAKALWLGIVLAACLILPSQGHAQAAFTDYVVYDANFRLAGTIGKSGGNGYPAQRYTYDANGRLAATESGSLAAWQATTIAPSAWAGFTVLRTTTNTYDSYGRVIQVVTTASGIPASIVQSSYDAYGRLSCTALRMNPAQAPAAGSDACVAGPAGDQGPDKITKQIYDALGRVIVTKSGVGTDLVQDSLTMTYGPDGEKTSIKDAVGNLTSMIYDGFDRLIRTNYPVTTPGAGQSDSGNYEAYTYDVNDQLLTYRRRDGVTIGFSYDALGQVLSKTIPGQSTVYSTYDLLGRQLSLTFDSPTGPGLAYTYDNASRVKTETSYGKTITYAYDKDNNLTSLTWPDGQSVTMTANTANQFSGVSKSGVFSVAYAYDAFGRVNQIKRGTTAQSVLGFDGFDRLTSLANTFATAPSNINYGLTYTPANQLKSLTVSNASYDWPVSATNQARVADGLNRDAGIAALQGGYDLRGNLTNDGTRQYGYDTENHLISVAGPVTAGLSYDPAGRLRQTVINGVTTQFLYSGNDLIAEMDGAGAILRRYVHGPGVNNPLVWLEGPGMAASGVRYLYKDRLGSITSWTNAAGVVQATFAYGPYGEPKAWGGSRFGYTGQVALSELGLYHYHARVYDPVTGRFLQTDPTGYDDGPNLYTYVNGDPINMVDPLGMAGEQAVIDTIVVTATKKTAFAALVAAVPVIGAIAGVVQGFNFLSKIFGPKKKPKVPKEQAKATAAKDATAGVTKKSFACSIAKSVMGNRIRAGVDGGVGLGPLFTAGTGISLEDSGRVVLDIYGGVGGGVAIIGGGGVSIDNGTTPNGLSNQTSGLMGQFAWGPASAGLNIITLDISNPNAVIGSLGGGFGPKLGGLLGFTKGGAYGVTLKDFQCAGG